MADPNQAPPHLDPMAIDTRAQDDASTTRHLLIAGTGRAGTSLLVRLFHACGVETELRHGGIGHWDDRAHAGLESFPFHDSTPPYVIKSPWSYIFLRSLLGLGRVKLDAIIVPIRRLSDATSSRIVLELDAIHAALRPDRADSGVWHDWGGTPGGVTYSLEPLDQARILSHSLHLLLETAVEHDIPVHFVAFPRFAEDPAYLYRKLRDFLPEDLDEAEFLARVTAVIDPDKIRVGKELAGGRGVLPTEVPANELPPIDELDRLALLREVRRLRQQLAAS